MKVFTEVIVNGNEITFKDSKQELTVDTSVFVPNGRLTLEFLLNTKFEELIKEELINKIKEDELEENTIEDPTDLPLEIKEAKEVKPVTKKKVGNK